MSIVSQITIILLALFILVILFRANRDLERAAMEGDHFVDSWAAAQERLEEKKKGMREVMQTSMEEEPGIAADREEEEAEEPETGLVLEAFDEVYRTKTKAMVHKLPFTIGRGEDNDMVLYDLSVARKHAVIERVNGCCILEDLGSMGGIITEGSSVRDVSLYEGLVFYLGNTKITVTGMA